MKGFIVSVAILTLLVLASCSPDHSTLEFAFESGVGTVKIEYYSVIDGEGKVNTVICPYNSGKGKIKLQTGDATVAFVSDDRGSIFCPVYIKGGSEIKISGPDNDLSSWKVEGDAVNEEITEWRLKHSEALGRTSVGLLNTEVAKYVESHPDRLSSAIILIVYYDRRQGTKEFRRLWSSLSEEVRNSEVLRSIDAEGKFEDESAVREKITKRLFYNSGDSVTEIDPRQHRVTIWYFRETTYHSDALRKSAALADSISGGHLVDVLATTDTIGWRGNIVKGTTAVWAPGAEQNASVKQFVIPKMPYIVATDSLGTQIFRGTSVTELAGSLRKYMK